MAKRAKSVWDAINEQIGQSIDDKKKALTGSILFNGAKKEWSNKISRQEMDITIEDLLTDEYYFGTFNVWPSVREELTEIWHTRCDFDVRFVAQRDDGSREIIKRDNLYAMSFEHAERRAQERNTEAAKDVVNTGGFIHISRPRNIHTVVLECPKGTGKNFESAIVLCLLVREYLIHDREELFRPYNLDLNTTISINLMNRTEDQARRVTFKEVLPKFNVPFFNDYFPPQVDLSDMEDKRVFPRELRFPLNVVLFPGTGTAASGLGYSIGAGIMDEANFLARTESSKQSILGTEDYDAADEIYADLYQRQESRFGALRNRVMCLAGLIVCISSTRTRQDFTQRMKRKAEKDPAIYYSSKYFWERKPLNLSGQTFTFDLNSMRVIDLPVKEKEYSQLIDVDQIAITPD